MGEPVKLSESLEDYLEAIFHLAAKRGVARARDIAERLKVNRSSVTGALQALAKKGLVDYEPYEVITLTRHGEAVAIEIVRRHEILQGFLEKVLSIDAAEADKAACRLEHAISTPILERLTEFLEFIETCPRGGNEWIAGFGFRCKPGDAEACRQCVSSCLDAIGKTEPDAAGGRVRAGRVRTKPESKKRRETGKRLKGQSRTAPRNGCSTAPLVARRGGADDVTPPKSRKLIVGIPREREGW